MVSNTLDAHLPESEEENKERTSAVKPLYEEYTYREDNDRDTPNPDSQDTIPVTSGNATSQEEPEDFIMTDELGNQRPKSLRHSTGSLSLSVQIRPARYQL